MLRLAQQRTAVLRMLHFVRVKALCKDLLHRHDPILLALRILPSQGTPAVKVPRLRTTDSKNLSTKIEVTQLLNVSLTQIVCVTVTGAMVRQDSIPGLVTARGVLRRRIPSLDLPFRHHTGKSRSGSSGLRFLKVILWLLRHLRVGLALGAIILTMM